MNRFGYSTNSLRKKPRGCGGIGRRVRFRSVWGQPHEGSSPFTRTTLKHEVRSQNLASFFLPDTPFDTPNDTFFRKKGAEIGPLPS